MLDNADISAPGSNTSPEPAGSVPAGAVQSVDAAGDEERSSDNGHWWSRFIQSRGHHDAPDEDASPTPERNGHEPIASASQSITLSQAELDERTRREAQRLFDRETARRNREQQEADRKRQRDEDPIGYVLDEKQREDAEKARQEQTQQLMTLLGHVGRQHDAVSIDPIVNALPEKERKRILELPQAGQGLPGRRVIVDEALKSYGRLEYERGYREAQAKLKKDPAFRKSVLSELRGSYEEPELYPGNGSPQEGLGDDNVSSILRRQYMNR